VAAAANRGGNVNLRDRRGIIFAGCVIGRRTVAIFALHTGQVGGVGKNSVLVGETEPGRQPVTHRVAGQTQAVVWPPAALNAGLLKALAWGVFATYWQMLK
jgi:hypothetical protein